MPSRREVYLMDGFKPTLGPKKLDESKFPTFRDGDVKIIISGSRQYQLHKSILKSGSPLFCNLLSDENTISLSNKAKKKGVVVTNMICAVIDGNPEDGKLPGHLLPVRLDEDGKTVSDMRLGLDLENGLMVPPVFTVRLGSCSKRDHSLTSQRLSRRCSLHSTTILSTSAITMTRA